jgi:hypothetical protein
LYKFVANKSIDLTKPNEAAIWRMAEDDIVQEMLAIKGEHRDKDGSNPVRLEEHDIIVEKYKIHHGAGKANPVGFVRFLADKEEEKKLARPRLDDLPVAVAHDVSNDGMQEQFVRVYCRSEESGKQELLTHVFKLWESERDSQAVVTANSTSCESDLDDDEQRESVPLTQEEEEDESSMGSPQRGIRPYDTDGEPSPFPAGNNRW